MLLFSIFVVIVGLFETSVAVYSFTGSRDVFPLHPNESTLLNGIKLFPLTRQLWKNNKFGAASTNDSGFGPAYPNVYVCWKDFLETCQKVTREGVCPEDERLDEFSNVVTNSGEALIGGTCTGGLIVMCVVFYFLYKLLKDDSSVHPTTGHVPQPDAATNQNTASSCPRCRSVPSSPPPAYNEVSAIEECADLSCA